MKNTLNNLTLKELRNRPKSYFKNINGVGVMYDRITNQYTFDIETCGFNIF